MTTRTTPWLPLVAALFAHSHGIAQDPVPTQDAPQRTFAEITIDQNGFVLPKGEILLTDLIDKASEYLGWNILFDDGEIAGSGAATQPIRFQRQLAVDALGCEDVLCEMLYMRDFALVTLDSDKKLYQAVWLSGRRGNEITNYAVQRSPGEILERPNLKIPVVTEIELQHLNANMASQGLRPFFAGMGSRTGQLLIGTPGSSATIMITGFQHRVAAAIRILRAADIPAAQEPRQRG